MCFMQDVHSFQPQRLALPPTWRAEPSGSTSDMTIEVVRASDSTTERFPVHRSALTSGPGRSRYFSDVLKPNKLPASPSPTPMFESTSSVSASLPFAGVTSSASPDLSMPMAPKAEQSVSVRVTLDDKVVELIPQLLDYVYSLPSFRLTTENAMGLRFLADLFKMPQLQDATWAFIRQDIGPQNLVSYLTEANYYEDSQTATWVAFEVAEHIHEIDESSPLLSIMAPSDFKQAISLSRMCRTGDPLRSGRLVAAFCEVNIGSLDERTFRELTNADDLPVVSRTVALKLMDLEFRIMRRDGSVPPDLSTDELSCLQRRCVRALAGK